MSSSLLLVSPAIGIASTVSISIARGWGIFLDLKYHTSTSTAITAKITATDVEMATVPPLELCEGAPGVSWEVEGMCSKVIAVV